MATTPIPPDDPFPENGDFDERRAWFARRLEGRLEDDCILIAARAALRVFSNLTYLQQEYTNKKSTQNKAITTLLPIMGCHALSAAASLAPAAERERFKVAASLRAIYGSLVVDFTLANSSNGNLEPTDGSAVLATNYAVAYKDGIGLVAAAVARASYSANRAVEKVDIVSVVDAASYALEDTTYINAASQSAFAVAAFEADLARLDGSDEARERLATSPLWLNAEGAPQEILDNWKHFSAQLRALGDDWDVWVEWYGGGTHEGKAFPGVLQGAKDGRYLFGLPTARALKLWHDVALLPNDLWESEPAALNAEFKRLVAEARGKAGKDKITLDDIVAVASPIVTLNDKQQLDVAPNPRTDKPNVDEDLIHLPARQRALIKTILASLPNNTPASIKITLHEYGDELLVRGVQPILGVLEDMFAITRKERDVEDSDQWLQAGLGEAFARFDANHLRLMEHFPLSIEREGVIEKLAFNQEALEPENIRKAISDVNDAAQAAYNSNAITEDFNKITIMQAETINIYNSVPPSSSEVSGSYAQKRGFVSILGFCLSALSVIADVMQVISFDFTGLSAALKSLILYIKVMFPSLS